MQIYSHQGFGQMSLSHILFNLLPPSQVYCRLRPLKEDEVESCAEAISDTVLQLTPPECSLAFKSGHKNGVSFHFYNILNFFMP